MYEYGLPVCTKGPSHDDTFSIVLRFVWILRLLNLTDEQLKGLGDILVVAGAGLGPGAVELLRHLATLLGRDLALLRPEIAFVADNDEWYPFDTLERLLGQHYAQHLGKGAVAGNQRTKWFIIFSRMTCTISNDCIDETE